MSRRSLTAVAALAGVVLAACGGSTTDDAAPATAEPTPVTEAPAEAPAPTEAANDAGDTTDATPEAEAPAPTDAADDSGDATDATPAAEEVPELLRFTSPLVGGGDFDAATTAGTPTAFWFWAPT